MAGPISHVVLAARVFDTYFSDKDKKEFFIATLLPDIRYLAGFKRDFTHKRSVDFKHIQAMDSFDAGLYFHSYVDILRIRILQSAYVSQGVMTPRTYSGSFKIAEDLILHSKILDWTPFIHYLDTVVAGERAFGIRENILTQWHSATQDIFRTKHTAKTLKRIGFSAQKIVRVQEQVAHINALPEVKKSVLAFYEHFAEHVAKHPKLVFHKRSV
ncbi:hypothetical protein COT72_02055 [archaeon CG10_big_fil_rev_8_21_14_0_10_43_11]|nr:MAG: hypothetical protein COT72_02055 [archaeon CG10_big_fil_rev_8_21_14_0_10_43_11]